MSDYDRNRRQSYAHRWNDQVNRLNNALGEHSGKGPKGYQRSDERIYEEVCEVLYDHGEIDASGITVRVENGEITMEGSVDSRQTKRMTEEAVEHLSGVRDVHNRLRIQEQPTHSNQQPQDITTGSMPTEVLAQDASIHE